MISFSHDFHDDFHEVFESIRKSQWGGVGVWENILFRFLKSFHYFSGFRVDSNSGRFGEREGLLLQ
jgi:hypothetical protein